MNKKQSHENHLKMFKYFLSNTKKHYLGTIIEFTQPLPILSVFILMCASGADGAHRCCFQSFSSALLECQ